MDPKATLRQLRELIRDYHGAATASMEATKARRLAIADEIVELCEALDEWLKKGGASPWAKAKK